MGKNPVDASEVKRLYTEDRLTMQEIADRLGRTKARVQQILQEQNVDTSHGAVPRPKPPRPARADEVKYRAYQMNEQTQGLIELLHAALNETRAAIVTRAIQELADRHLPQGRNTRLAAGEKAGGDEASNGDGQAGPKRRRRAAAAAASPDAPPADAAPTAKGGTAKPVGRRSRKKES